MRWYRNLYLGDNAKKAKYKVFGRIRKGRFTSDVVWLAKGREEALYLVRDIIDEVYSNTKGFDIAGYLHFGVGRNRE